MHLILFVFSEFSPGPGLRWMPSLYGKVLGAPVPTRGPPQSDRDTVFGVSVWFYVYTISQIKQKAYQRERDPNVLQLHTRTLFSSFHVKGVVTKLSQIENCYGSEKIKMLTLWRKMVGNRGFCLRPDTKERGSGREKTSILTSRSC